MNVVAAKRAMTATYRPRRLGHINLNITDLKRNTEFLTKTCGIEITALESYIGAGFYSNGNTHHDLGVIESKEYAERKGKMDAKVEMFSTPGLNHFGWELENEELLVAAYFSAVEAGIDPSITDQGTGRSNYVTGPDGTLHQFYVDKIVDWRKIFSGGETKLHENPRWIPGAQPATTDSRYDPNPVIRRVETAPLHPMKVTHATMRVPDMEASVNFYVDIGGFMIAHATPDRKCVYLRGTASHYDLIFIEDTSLSKAEFLCASFEVWPTDDLDKAARDLKALGVDVLHRDKAAHKDSLHIPHPDGFLFEFYRRGHSGFRDVDAAAVKDRIWVA